MSIAIQVAGPLMVKCDAAGALADLGYSDNGIRIASQDYRENVPGDENGGDVGLPIEVIRYGSMHIVSFELTKWDALLASIVDTRVKNGTPGSSLNFAMYMAESKTMRLLLIGQNFIRNYIAAIPSGDLVLGPVGSRYSRKAMAFECYPVNGVLYNTVAS